jgi:hypothetical protein
MGRGPRYEPGPRTHLNWYRRKCREILKARGYLVIPCQAALKPFCFLALYYGQGLVEVLPRPIKLVCVLSGRKQVVHMRKRLEQVIKPLCIDSFNAELWHWNGRHNFKVEKIIRN